MSKLVPTLLQTISISTSLIAAGGIATLTFFDVPILQSQPASRSLPSTRWLFSRGSHVFPTAALISAAGFGVLAVQHLATPLSSMSAPLLRDPAKGVRGLVTAVGGRSWMFIAAGLLCLSIAPYTSIAMIPNNFALIKKNADKGGMRSAKAAELVSGTGTKAESYGSRSAQESVDGQGEGDEYGDLSGPQERTVLDTTPAEDEEVREMLGQFGRHNLLRASLMAAGGMVGIVAAVM
ncbi:hypothetical protein BD289DRAFT_74366 [Coniella lustricola]|uniref:DUF1772-domain-containing protein n=1 Tax=Coniella lustricola TaxID=2025994 RepID=A0A2T3AHR5_9PEZI|nr:hypothetical protein BD289DRAFT_74366 [Coniella lustricola]